MARITLVEATAAAQAALDTLAAHKAARTALSTMLNTLHEQYNGGVSEEPAEDYESLQVTTRTMSALPVMVGDSTDDHLTV
jgi:hypothetical protein